MEPVISVIMPVYQVETFIGASVRSVVAQTFRSFEIILVNDGTRDNSIEVAMEILEGSNIPFRIISQENKGLAAARNTGIRESRCEWVICIDADDILAPEFLERLYTLSVLQNTRVSLANYRMVMPNTIINGPDSTSGDQLYERDEIMYLFLTRKLRIIAPGMFLRRDFVQENQLWYDESIRFSEDQHLIWRVLLAADRVACMQDRLYYYLQRQGSITTTTEPAKIVTGFTALKKLESRFPDGSLVRRYFLPRWVFGALNASTRMMDFNRFILLARQLCYKKTAGMLLRFPDLKVAAISGVLLVSPRLFFFLGKHSGQY
jgi:glycosyltransferase involved in cell wall biosynthesis